MKKVKQIFPSRNYITIDTTGDIEIIFNPVGDGFEGDDKLQFRRGRWAFRCNDFLAGKMLPNGENESMNRKIYSLNLVYDTENGEPIVNTTYVDPTSVIPLDGSLVSGDWLKEADIETLKSDVSSIYQNVLMSASDVNEMKDSLYGVSVDLRGANTRLDNLDSLLSLVKDNLVGVSDYIGSDGTLSLNDLPIGRYKYKGLVMFDGVDIDNNPLKIGVVGAVLDINITSQQKQVFLRGYDTLRLEYGSNHVFSTHGYLSNVPYFIRFSAPTSIYVHFNTDEINAYSINANGSIKIY